MSVPTAESVLKAAMQLTQAERIEIAANLLESLPEPPNHTEETLEELLTRRMMEIDTGQVETIPWDVVRRELRPEK